MAEEKKKKKEWCGSMRCGVPLSPLVMMDSLARKSFSYDKLPQTPLKLTVLKLDHSFFQIEVVKTATVAELKKAVEAAFSHLPKEGPGKVSWSHVWGHFCLCYDGQKLIKDGDYIADYDIRDGDQLLFVRHLSMTYTLKKTKPVEQVADLDQPRQSDVGELEDERTGVEESCVDQEISASQNDDIVDENVVITHTEYKLTTIFRGLFSYHKLSLSSDTNYKQKSCSNSPKLANGLFGCFRKVVRGYGNKRYPLIEAWRVK